MEPFLRLFIIVGGTLLGIGLVLWLAQKVGFPIGRLPGDIVIQNESFSFYFPITTCILASIILTLVVRGLR